MNCFTVVNHVQTDINCDRQKLWSRILSEIADAERYTREGYILRPIEEGNSPLGGGRLILEKSKERDEILYYITERDEKSCRLSLKAEFLGVHASGMISYASYHALDLEKGSRYNLDCHTTMQFPDNVTTAAAMRRHISDVQNMFQIGMQAALEELKVELEASS